MENYGGGFSSKSAREAGRKSKGGGRPRRALADLMDVGGSTAIEHLLDLVDLGEKHPLYMEALRELTRACLPKRRATDMAVAAEPQTFVELARQLSDAASK